MERRVIQDFIEIYRCEPSLWKIRSAHYNNKSVKSAAYRRMVAKLREIYPDADVEMVKRKINALRTNYRKELRKVTASQERHRLTGEPLYAPSLWYYELFHFIADQEEELHGESAAAPVIDVAEESPLDLLRVDFEESGGYEGDEMSDEFDDEFQASSPESQKNSIQNARHMNSYNGHPPSKKPRNSRYSYSESQEDRNWYASTTSESTPPPDNPEVFGRYVASKLRQMDRSNQMLTERLISEVLFRGQMGLLTRRTSLTQEESPVTIKVEEGAT